ncbi:hypothetical protein SO802_009095 [Lithocarpus litseifolius]|uniref:Disease resistance RPP13-like protein 1 n=1 Tax=Lithocarpus litseifolius TaxID=425828 RepID=A0AAW2DAH8_9ROSI
MAGAILSSFIQAVLEGLSTELLNYAHPKEVKKELEKWKNTLPEIKATLEDAEEKQQTERAVKKWLDDLRDFAYDLEDMLDEFATEGKLHKLKGKAKASTSNSRMGSKMTEISARFEDIMTKKRKLNLRKNVDRKSYGTRGRLPPTSLVNEAHVYGREDDKEGVLQFLFSENYSADEVSVIPIVGMGGIGKTTLAQLVYNDAKVNSYFDMKAWACVSEEFDGVKVTKTILKYFSSDNCDDNDLNLLQVKLKEKLYAKKFPVILDDVWNENYNDWTILRAPFEVGAPGSRIVITTRNEGVSSMMGTIPTYALKELSDDACLSIFTRNALGTKDFNAHPDLTDIGEEIVKKCKGLPLAAKTLGGLLRTELDRSEWEDVLNSKIWEIPEERSGIVPALMLSYYHLPSHLKRCFAYCSILPKDYEFEEQHLVLLWMAEGLIQLEDGRKSPEDLGSEYFRNLLSRSFFQQSSKDKSRFLMHDLINDLAQWVAGDICFRMGDKLEVNNIGKFSKQVRHFSYLGGRYDGTKRFEAFSEVICIRTFLPLMLPNPGHCYLTSDVPFNFFPKLRVLSLSGYCITELPDSIVDLKHLRYIDLSHTRIRSLPESIAFLCNLQTLILENCVYLKKLPSKFGNLVKLRHLNILKADSLEGIPPQLGKLTCLRTLSNLVVGKGHCSKLKELGFLTHIRGTLCISRLENVTVPRDARDANLIGKPGLNELLLEWSSKIDESQDRTNELDVLNMLQSPKALKKLTIRCYGGTRFPTWLRAPSFPNMMPLRIENCKKCTSLPPVGHLPSLKALSIKGMARVKNVGPESLETLCFENMQEWESWTPCGEFPCLRQLSITSCPKLLGKLPNQLPSLENFVINGCRQLVVSVSSFPMQCNLEIEKSKRVVQVEFTCQTEGPILGLEKVEDTIDNCEELVSLWSNDVGLQHLRSLRVLKISTCPKLMSLVAEEVEEQLQLGLPFTLREIQIINCNALVSIPKAMMYNISCLERISIDRCDSLTSFAIGQLPPTLKWLKIDRCKNMLIFLEKDDINYFCSYKSLLEYLEAVECPSLKSLTSSGELPATLKQLHISSCQNLESIAKRLHDNSSLERISNSDCDSFKSLPMGIHTLSSLDEIHIWNCPSLVTFLDGGLLPTSLRVLWIFGCKDMQALPNCIHNLTSLQELNVWECPGIVKFPEEGFPTNITSLFICDLKIYPALFKWGLDKFTFLRQLNIRVGCPNLVSFPEMMLPASLQIFPNLKYLSSKGFQILTFLEYLSIYQCERLKSFPKDGLPSSLLELHVQRCPLLKERCKKFVGQEWSKIALIPCVQLGGRFIYDTENEN